MTPTTITRFQDSPLTSAVRLFQGSRANLGTTLSNPDEGHPLNPEGANPDGSDSGLNTPGYTLCFVAAIKQANLGGIVPDSKITIDGDRVVVADNGETAEITLLPSDTSELLVVDPVIFVYEVWVSLSGDEQNHSYLTERGQFTLQPTMKNQN